MGTWRGAMMAALVATVGRPAWWSMALAAFLIRGGIIVVLLPLVAVPSVAALTAALSPTVSTLAFSGLTSSAALTTAALLVLAVALLAGAALAGAWLDLAQLREAATDEDMELTWAPIRTALRDALALRLAAHLPTLAAIAYAAFRLIGATYDELLAPGDTVVPLPIRIVGRAPEALGLLVGTWLIGEAIGGLAARSSAAGAPFGAALVASVRQVLGWRGLRTLVVTTVAVLGALWLHAAVAGHAWQQLRAELFGTADQVLIGAALLMLVSAWILGLAILGAALAWRNAAWTAVAVPARRDAPQAALIVVEA